MRNITIAAFSLALALPASAGILDAVFPKPKAQAVDPAQYAGLTHLIVIGGATDYKAAQEELLGRLESGLQGTGCWRVMGHHDAGERIHHPALKAPSPVDWDDEADVSSGLLETLPKRDERLGVMIFWVTGWSGQAYDGGGAYQREALAQVFDSATGDEVWRARMLIPAGAAGGDARLPAADKARREDRALSEYDLFASYFVGNLSHPPNMDSACRPRADSTAAEEPVSAKALAVVDPVARAAAALKSRDAAARAQAAKTLGQTQDDAAVGPLIQALSDPELKVRAYALDALGELGSAAAVDAVALELADKSKLARALAARALGRIASPRAAPALERLLLAEKEPLVRKLAQASLERIERETGITDFSLDRGLGRP